LVADKRPVYDAANMGGEAGWLNLRLELAEHRWRAWISGLGRTAKAGRNKELDRQ